MLSNKIIEILNEQINREFYSGYLYLSISARFKEMGLYGFASWLREQTREEVEHGLKIFDYLIDCESFVTLKQINMPEIEFHGILSTFELIYEHEKGITKSIAAIAELSEQECDRRTLGFIDWFIEEQIEEEKNIKDIIKKLEIFGDDHVALFIMDKELQKRKS